jgi:hypothetical protein
MPHLELPRMEEGVASVEWRAWDLVVWGRG